MMVCYYNHARRHNVNSYNNLLCTMLQVFPLLQNPNICGFATANETIVLLIDCAY